MTVDAAGILYGADSPLYSVLGSAATLVDVDGESFALTVIDKTAGVNLDIGGDIAVNALTPACVVRSFELAQVDAAKIKRGRITFNGATWEIDGKLPRPGPSGESSGEVFLLLTGTDE